MGGEVNSPERSSKLEGGAGGLAEVFWLFSTSTSWLVTTSGLLRLKVNLSPPTETKVALDLSPTSLGGESPVARLGFFLGLMRAATMSWLEFSSEFFSSARLSSSALAFIRLFL